MPPTVVIAGRPNVGKSTLFNKLAGRRYALVSDTPGVTRDFKEATAQLRGRMVRLIDTAGLEESAPETLFGRMRASSETAIGHLVRNRQPEGGSPGEARLGSKVTVVEDGFSEQEVFMIVGVAEADPRRGRVSNESPMGKALPRTTPLPTPPMSWRTTSKPW